MADEIRRCLGVVRVRSAAVAKKDRDEEVVCCDWRRDLKLGSNMLRAHRRRASDFLWVAPSILTSLSPSSLTG